MKKGFITLLAVTILGAVGILIASSVLLLSTVLAQNDIIGTNAQKSAHFADACLENSLENIRGNPGFVGTENLNFTDGNCTSTTFDLGGERRKIEITGLAGNTTKRIRAVINQINPEITIESWQEVADF